MADAVLCGPTRPQPAMNAELGIVSIAVCGELCKRHAGGARVKEPESKPKTHQQRTRETRVYFTRALSNALSLPQLLRIGSLFSSSSSSLVGKIFASQVVAVVAMVPAVGWWLCSSSHCICVLRCIVGGLHLWHKKWVKSLWTNFMVSTSKACTKYFEHSWHRRKHDSNDLPWLCPVHETGISSWNPELIDLVDGATAHQIENERIFRSHISRVCQQRL